MTEPQAGGRLGAGIGLVKGQELGYLPGAYLIQDSPDGLDLRFGIRAGAVDNVDE